MSRNDLKTAKKIVVKVGTSSIIDDEMRIDQSRIDSLVDDITRVRETGRDVILVSSGAIGAGTGKLGLKSRPTDIPTQQAVASVGQNLLMNAYERSFSRYGIVIGQVLLTRDDFSHRRRYTNICNTMTALLRNRIVPIINENDTVGVDEIKVGDNDMLSAFALLLADAQLLIILSDIDGLYTSNPKSSPDARLLDVVDQIDDALRAYAGGRGSDLGTGGMSTKLSAAEVVTESGEYAVIANSSIPMVISRILDGERIGTLFLPRKDRRRLSGRKRWIAYSSRRRGRIEVDRGACLALTEKGASLLASGITKVEDDFDFGDTVSCINQNGVEFARGLSNYSSDELRRIAGCQTSEIKSILGYKYYDEVIHRDNLVILRTDA